MNFYKIENIEKELEIKTLSSCMCFNNHPYFYKPAQNSGINYINTRPLKDIIELKNKLDFKKVFSYWREVNLSNNAKKIYFTTFKNNSKFLKYFYRVPKTEKSFFEIIENETKTYFDLDGSVELEIQEKKDLLDELIILLKEKYKKDLNLELKDEEILVTGDPNDHRLKLHITINNGYKWENTKDLAMFVKSFGEDINKFGIDGKAYNTNQQFRTVFSKKPFRNNYNYPLNKNLEIIEKDITKNNYKTFLKYFNGETNEKDKYYNFKSHTIVKTSKQIIIEEDTQEKEYNKWFSTFVEGEKTYKKIMTLFRLDNLYDLIRLKIIDGKEYAILKVKDGKKHFCKSCNKIHKKELYKMLIMIDGEIKLKCFKNDEYEYLGIFPYVYDDLDKLLDSLEIEMFSTGKIKDGLALHNDKLTKTSYRMLSDFLREVIQRVELCGKPQYYIKSKKYCTQTKQYYNDWINILHSDFLPNLELEVSHSELLKDIFISLLRKRKIKRFNQTDFIPYSKNNPLENTKVLNIFTPFEQSLKFKNNIDFTKTTIFEHIYNILCSGDENKFNYVLSWISRIFQKPDSPKKNTLLCFITKLKGVGKNTLYEFLKRVIGIKYCNSYSSMARYFQRFNNINSGSLLALFEEIQLKDSAKFTQLLKDIITNPSEIIEQKHRDSKQQSNFKNFLGFSNNYSSVIVESGSRRFTIIVCKEKIKDLTYFSKIYKEINDPLIIKSAYDFFNNFKITHNTTKPFETEIKKMLQKINMCNQHKFIIDYCENKLSEGKEKNDIIQIHSKPFLNAYRRWYEDNILDDPHKKYIGKSTTFRMKITLELLNSIKYKDGGIIFNGKRSNGYIFKIGDIEEALKKSDPEFKFIIRKKNDIDSSSED